MFNVTWAAEKMKRVFEGVVYQLLQGLIWLLGSMPLSWCRRCGTVLGYCLHTVSRRRRKIAMDNLGLAFPDKSLSERAKLCRQIFVNLGMSVFEIFWSYRLDQKSFSRFFRIEGREYVDKAYAQGRGILSLTAHFGNWEELVVVNAMLDYPASILYRPLDFPPLERLITKMRGRFGARPIPRKKSLRQVIRALGEKHMIGILFDQRVGKKEAVYVPFFGHPVSCSNGLALLALKTKAPVVPAFLVREKDGFCAQFLPEIPLIETGDKFKDIKQNTVQYNRVMEKMIRRYPEQWFWVHRRWRSEDYSNWLEQEKFHSR